jgi:hypothetical protein
MASLTIRPPGGEDDEDWMDVVDDHAGWRGHVVPGGMATRPDRWSGVVLHRLIESSASGRIGYATVYNYDPRISTAWASVAALPTAPPMFGLLGCALCIDEAFQGWPIRRIMFEASVDRTGPYASLWDLPFVEQYGTLTDLLSPSEGRSGDRVLFGISRRSWDADVRPLLRRFLTPTVGVPSRA